MNIGIDARALSENKAGIGIYTEEIIKHISESDKENKYFLYSTREIFLDIKLNDNFEIKDNLCKKLGSFWFYFKLPKVLKNDNIDVYWGTQHHLPKRNKNTKNIKFVLTVHDLAIKKLKTVGSFKNTIIQKLFLRKSIKNADHIIAISESTKNDIIELFKKAENEITVIYNGTNLHENNIEVSEEEVKEIREKFKIENTPYIFFVSTIEPRKNIETLIRAYDYIRRREKTVVKLILAGGLGWKYESVLNLVDKSENKKDIIMPGYISKEEKAFLFKNAECFVYPSLYEGFGLPILEAMANKCLVVTANNSSLPEVGGDAAFYYEGNLDYAMLGNRILDVMRLSEEEKNKKIEQGLEQTKKFTWKKCAKEVLEILSTD